jgi:hypothetical protein
MLALALATWLLSGLQPTKAGAPALSGQFGANSSTSTAASERLARAIDLSAGYLIRQCRPNGEFLYRVNLNPAIRPKPRYNFLRHAGAIYVLADYERDHPQAMTRAALKRAVAYLKKSAIAPLPMRKDILAVWSRPEITRSDKSLQAKLGGTGIGLVALLGVENTMPGTTPLEYLRKMGNFIIFMQKNDGSFYSKYIPEKGGRDDSWTSLYYPGEAALGLLMLHERDPSLAWLQAAADSIAYLARKREGQKRVEADHWALLATAKLLPLYNRCRQPLPKQALERHAAQICESILQSKLDLDDDSLRYGSFLADGRTTPTAIRLEGMLAALSFLPADYSRLRQAMIVGIDEGIQFLLRSQIRSGEHAGGIPRAIDELPEDHPQYEPSFNRRASEVRIDYVQHALSAMLHYARIFRQADMLN